MNTNLPAPVKSTGTPLRLILAALSCAAALSLPLPAATFTFANTNSIGIADSMFPPTAATLYPSTITVTGLQGLVITKVTVELRGLEHASASDVDVTLISPPPGRSNIVVMANVGNTGYEVTAVTNAFLIFDDNRPTTLKTETPIVSGSYKPSPMRTTYYYPYPAPAAAFPPNPPLPLSALKGMVANGDWNLCVTDCIGYDAGVIRGGWALNISVAESLKILPTASGVRISWPAEFSPATLVSRDNLATGSWTAVTNSPVNLAGRLTVDLPAADQQRFFKLQ